MKHIRYTVDQCIGLDTIKGLVEFIPEKYYEACVINDMLAIRITTDFTIGVCIERVDDDIDDTGYDNSGGR